MEGRPDDPLFQGLIRAASEESASAARRAFRNRVRKDPYQLPPGSLPPAAPQITADHSDRQQVRAAFGWPAAAARHHGMGKAFFETAS